MRDGLRSILEREGGIEVVATASNGREKEHEDKEGKKQKQNKPQQNKT